MARTLGNSTTSSVALSGGSDHAVLSSPPPAVRANRPGWRDPRLWVGIAIVAACIVAGARLLGSADDTVAVWGVRSDAGAGAVLDRSDLEVHHVHFASADDLAGYLRADAALPDQLSLTRGVGGGELLPRAAVASGTPSDTVQLPLSVDPGQVPPTVRSGSVVDVYVVGPGAGSHLGSGDSTAGDDAAGDSTADDGTAGDSTAGGSRASRDPGAAEPALSAVTVVTAPTGDDVFGAGETKRQLTLAVPERRAQEFFGLLGDVDDPTVTVVLRPAG